MDFNGKFTWEVLEGKKQGETILYQLPRSDQKLFVKVLEILPEVKP